MYLPLITIPLLLTPAWGFTAYLYTTKHCTGTTTSYNTSVADGCRTDRGGEFSGLINLWRNEDDNKLILATYSDSKCCHNNMIEMYDWKKGCVQVPGAAQSWRVLNPDEPDKGKDGDDYNCGGIAE